MRSRLADDPSLEEIRRELLVHSMFSHAIAGEVCDECRWLHSREECYLEAHLERFNSRRSAA